MKISKGYKKSLKLYKNLIESLTPKQARLLIKYEDQFEKERVGYITKYNREILKKLGLK